MMRRLLVSCLLLISGFGSVRGAQGALITQTVWRNSTNTGSPKVVSEGLQVGSPAFVDRINVNNRTTRYASIPEFLRGLEYVMLANNDRATAAGLYRKMRRS